MGLVLTELTIDGKDGGIFIGNNKPRGAEMRRLIISLNQNLLSLRYFDHDELVLNRLIFQFRPELYTNRELTFMAGFCFNQEVDRISLVLPNGDLTKPVSLESPLYEPGPKGISIGLYQGQGSNTISQKLLLLEPKENQIKPV